MRDHDENAPEGPTGDRTAGDTRDGVALSPYDADLASPATAAEPDSYRLDDSPGYAADDAVPADVPAGPAPTAVAAADVQDAESVESTDSTAPTDATVSAGSATPAETADPGDADDDAADDDVAARWSAVAAGAGAGAGAAAAGFAAPRADTPISDTAVRRSSLMAHQPSNEPRRLMTEPEADARAERYAPDADLFAGASYDKVPSRAGAHWWSMLATLLLTPVAWYLLSDAGARMTLPADNQWDSGVLNLAALGELLGGILVLAVILIAARASSLGAFVVGALVALGGGAFVVAPTLTQDVLAPSLEWLAGYNDFGGNIAHHLVADGSTGRILVAGIALVLVGFVSHSARRRGRREQTIRDAIERRKVTGF